MAPRRRGGGRLPVAALVSVLLHGLFIAAVVLDIDPRRARRPEELPPPTFAVVFQGGSDQAPRAAEAPEDAPTPDPGALPAPPPPPPLPTPPVPPAPPVAAAPPTAA
ncbi:hypothetical protein, partial [Roseomonas sp. CECT 9278]|uniref:hypothetical protein n=1 Tax=Roseomonas sp. CECT 9278 TaxID=2845823 RepID=UPI001E56F9B1